MLLIVLRFIDGMFMGGEYTSNNTLALEMVPKDRRGFVGGVLQGAFPIGFALVSAVTSLMLGVTTKDQYMAWGWRIPFVFGGVLAFIFLLYYRLVPESGMWLASEKSSAPLEDVVRDASAEFGPGVPDDVGFWLITQASVILPGMMIQHLHVPSRITSERLPGRQPRAVLRFRRLRAAEPDARPAAGDRSIRGCRADAGLPALLRHRGECAGWRLCGPDHGHRCSVLCAGGFALGDRHDLHLRAVPDPGAGQRLRHRL